jgi:hypothetical protein
MVLPRTTRVGPEQLVTVPFSPQPTRPGRPIGSVQGRQAGLPEPLRALHRRLLAGFLTHPGPPEPAAVADLAAELGLDPCQAYLQAHPGLTGELLGQTDAVATARRIFGGLLDPSAAKTIDDLTR